MSLPRLQPVEVAGLGITCLLLAFFFMGYASIIYPPDTISFIYERDGVQSKKTSNARDITAGIPPHWMQLVYIQNNEPLYYRGKAISKIVAVQYCRSTGECGNWFHN